MPRLVMVGSQQIEFPDSFTDDQIDAIVQRDFFSPAKKAEARLAARGVDPNVPVDADANRPSMLPDVVDAAQQSYQEVLIDPLKRVASNAAGLAAMPFQIAGEEFQQARGAVSAAAGGDLAPLGKEILSNVVDPGGVMERGAANVIGGGAELVNQIREGRLGDTMGDVATGAILSRVPGAVDSTVSGVRSLADKGAARVRTSQVKPTNADMAFNSQPAEAIKGMTAATKGGLASQLEGKIIALDNQLQRILKDPAIDTPSISITDAISEPLKVAIDFAERGGNPAAIERLTSLAQAQYDDAMKITGGRDLATPAEAHTFKKRVNEMFENWSEEPGETSNRAALQGMYRSIDHAIDAAAPGAQPLNKAMSDAIVAKRGTTRQIQNEARKDITLNPFANVDRLANATPVKTALANTLDKFGHGEAVRNLRAQTAQFPALAGQLIASKRGVYVSPTGEEIPVPNGIMMAMTGGRFDETTSPVSKWLDAMAKQGKIKDGGRLMFVDR